MNVEDVLKIAEFVEDELAWLIWHLQTEQLQ